ncbi:hypothetical protein KI387_000727, partial [Taxus chinensis]
AELDTESNMEEKAVVEDPGNDRSYTLSEDAYDDECEKSLSEVDSESNLDCPSIDAEIEEMIDEFLE